MMHVQEMAKAIVGGALAGVGTAQTALADGQVTGVEWCMIVSSVLVVFGAVFGVSNADPKPKAAIAVEPAPVAAPLAPVAASSPEVAAAAKPVDPPPAA